MRDRMDDKLIFLTNDDGYNSRGMQAAIQVARQFGRVVVVAPEEPQSGMSHAFTMYKPLHLRKISETDQVTIYALSGTPVDCVKMAFDHLLVGQKVDLVISGINHGSNSAVNILYSGTMAAAVEGSFYHCLSVGLSLDDHMESADFEASIYYGERIIREVLASGAELPLCLNVNIPAVKKEQIRGMRICRQASGFWREDFSRREDPRGKEYFWLMGAFVNQEPEAEDTDEWALRHDYVAIVPVQVDLTAYARMKELDAIIH
ncbi:MAG: 5'/3'-nucleotidase SurE [Alistipes sp.]